MYRGGESSPTGPKGTTYEGPNLYLHITSEIWIDLSQTYTDLQNIPEVWVGGDVPAVLRAVGEEGRYNEGRTFPTYDTEGGKRVWASNSSYTSCTEPISPQPYATDLYIYYPGAP